MMEIAVWAFRPASEERNPDTFEEVRSKIGESAMRGKSRFGWSWKNEHNLNISWSKCHLEQQFLLLIKPGDWIVHVNVPEQDLCVTAKVTGAYQFGGEVLGDYQHYIPVDPTSARQFNRKTDAPQALRFDLGLHTRDAYTRQRAWKFIETEKFLEFVESLSS